MTDDRYSASGGRIPGREPNSRSSRTSRPTSAIACIASSIPAVNRKSNGATVLASEERYMPSGITWPAYWRNAAPGPSFIIRDMKLRSS